MSKPARAAISVAATNWSRTRSMSARVISAGVALPSAQGIGLADISGQLPVSSGWSIPSHPSRVEPLRPAWPIWQQILGLGLIFAFTGTLVTMGYGIVAGYAGHVIGRRLGLINKIAALMFAALAIRLVAK